MASLTPARILGREKDLGSLTPGKRADVVILDRGLKVKQVYIDGQEFRE
jgi:N-acetylglucosamine-6-phosphate deacetylase